MWVFLSHVIGVKKPAGTAEEIEKHFGCKSSHLIMVRQEFIELVNSFNLSLCLDVWITDGGIFVFG